MGGRDQIGSNQSELLVAITRVRTPSPPAPSDHPAGSGTLRNLWEIRQHPLARNVMGQ
jgi:hypothetical protein